MLTNQETAQGLKTKSDLEQAIETIGRFALPNKSRSIPTLEPFDLTNGKIQVIDRSSLKKSLSLTKSLLQTFSPYYRVQQREKRRAIAGTLQASVDLIKVYSSALQHMKKGSVRDQELAEKLLQAASNYNAVIKQAKKSPHNLSDKIKRFFFHLVGWQIDETFTGTEIYLPESVEYLPKLARISHKQSRQFVQDVAGNSSSNAPEHCQIDKASAIEGKFAVTDCANCPRVCEKCGLNSLAALKVTVKKESKLTGLLESVQKLSERDKLKPKKEEIDAFHLKALTLLKQHESQTGLSLNESIEFLHRSSIESEFVETASNYGTSIIALSQQIFPFPGETIQLTGQFQRDSFHSNLCFPLPSTFKLYTSSTQSGFPHPLQYIGFTLHEKLLPTFILRPKALPGIQNLLEKNRFISHELMHCKNTRMRAKQLLKNRKDIFNNKKQYMLLLQETIIAFSEASNVNNKQKIIHFFELAGKSKAPFDFVSEIHAEITKKVIAEPLEALQREWLFNNNPDVKDPEYCKEVFYSTLKKASDCFSINEHPLVGTYQKQIALSLQPAVCTIFLLELSEHLGFLSLPVSPFEQKLLTSLLRQQLIFTHELQQNISHEANFELYVETQLHEEIALFSGISSNDPHTLKAAQLTTELIDYFA